MRGRLARSSIIGELALGLPKFVSVGKIPQLHPHRVFRDDTTGFPTTPAKWSLRNEQRRQASLGQGSWRVILGNPFHGGLWDARRKIRSNSTNQRWVNFPLLHRAFTVWLLVFQSGLHRDYSYPPSLSNVGELSWSWTFSINRDIRHFHVVVVQKGQRNE